MGRRHRLDPRPPVEILGADEPATEGQRVELGRERAGGRRGAGRRALLAVGVVAALLAGGVALGSGDEHERSPAGLTEEEHDNEVRRQLKDSTTTSGASSRTTDGTTVPEGPVLGSPTGAALLLVAGTSAVHLDLDTGEHSEVRLPGTDGWRLVGVSGGVVTIDERRAVYVPLPGGEPLIDLGPAENVLPAGAPDRVWLLSGLGLERTESQQTAVLVDLTGEPLTAPVAVPACCPVGATEAGVLFTAGGRTYVAGEEGITPLSPHPVLTATSSHVVELVCDDDAVCAAEVVDTATGQRRRLDPLPGAQAFGVPAALSPDGKVAVLSQRGQESSLRVYDELGRRVGVVDALVSAGPPLWLPGDNGLVVHDSYGVHLVRDDGGVLVVAPIAALDDELGDRIVLIPTRGCCDGSCRSPCGAGRS